MANEKVWIEGNVVHGNTTAPFMVVAYTKDIEDERYNPYPREVVIAANNVGAGATNPDLPGAELLLPAFGGVLPPILWDGLNDPAPAAAPALAVTGDITGWSLNLTRQGQPLGEARPGLLDAQGSGAAWDMSGIGAPAELEARLP
jgi:hypothetical protein